MRGQFMTHGALRLLIVVLFVYLLFCHPFRKKLYVPLFFGFAGASLAIVDAVVDRQWTFIAMGACFLVLFISLAVQHLAMQNKRRKEETRQ